VLVLHAPEAAPDAGDALSAEQEKLMRALLAELSVRDAARIGAAATGVSRDRLYAWALRQSP
jgi:16S rRNA (cytidine1402-2'-O)-methyltransferase